jgi:hypothetical protein
MSGYPSAGRQDVRRCKTMLENDGIQYNFFYLCWSAVEPTIFEKISLGIGGEGKPQPE